MMKYALEGAMALVSLSAAAKQAPELQGEWVGDAEYSLPTLRGKVVVLLFFEES